jgi:hypothetical protein
MRGGRSVSSTVTAKRHNITTEVRRPFSRQYNIQRNIGIARAIG